MPFHFNQMMFPMPIQSIPQSIGGLSDLSRHDNGQCQVTQQSLFCGLQDDSRVFKVLKFTYKDGKSFTYGGTFANEQPNLVSVDFYKNKICIVTSNGDVGCGGAVNLISKDAVAVSQISGAHVTQVRLCQYADFMCIANSNSEVWCSKQDFTKKQVWSKMVNLKGADGIRIESRQICGHMPGTNNNVYQCIDIGSKFDSADTKKATVSMTF
eukprot:NODE_45_length_32908_cov_0.790271.p21 type:complete len:211 gc:universal NODE_45_length_32908_cov_0.790271:18130-17498(-)